MKKIYLKFATKLIMEVDKFRQLIDKGVDITQYLLLSYLNMNVDLKDVLNNVKINGSLSVMEKKGYIEKIGEKIYNITEKGKSLLGIQAVVEDGIKEKDWVEKLYEEVEQIIVKNTGKKQHMNGSGKYYKPANPIMLKNRIAVFFKKFGMQDYKKVSSAILKYTDKVTKGEIKYALTLLYFIYKEERMGIKSELLDWMSDVEEEKTGIIGIIGSIDI